MRKLIYPSLALALCICHAGCTRPEPAGPQKMYRMGERIEVGSMVYTVLDAEWLDHLGTGAAARLPQHRYLSVRLSATNGGASVVTIPPMAISSASGDRFEEIQEASALSEWLGYIRSVKPADTLHGRVVFDAPPGEYQLKLSAGTGDPETDTVVSVDLPLRL
jgi:hypothetical protein